MTRAICLCFLMLCGGTSLWAKPVSYALDITESKVVFFYTMGGQENQGVFPISSATTLVDLQDVRRSSLDVKIATKFTRAGDPFVTLAIKGPDLLATGEYPYARFVSTRVVPNADGARITGDLTLKGVTRPITLDAVFQRRADAPADNSELILKVSGEVKRAAFGVTGFPKLVDDTISLRFLVHLVRE